MAENENPAPAVAEPAVAEPIAAADPSPVPPLDSMINAVEVMINVVRQLSESSAALSGLAGYANQIEYWIKEARAGLDPQPAPPEPVPALPPPEPAPVP